MTQRAQKQIKTLQNKLANIDADIERIQKELNLEGLTKEKELLEQERVTLTNTVAEENSYKEKIDACSAMIKDYESQKLDAELKKKKSLLEENEIYKNEMSRIDFEYTEWRTYLTEKLASLGSTRTDIIMQLDELNAQKNEHETTIQNYQTIKRDLRLQNMNTLLSQQLEYKKNKAHYKNQNETLAGLHMEKSLLEFKINDYTQLRFKINNDFYEWKNEVDALNKELKPYESISVDVMPTKQLKEKYKKKMALAKDPRQDYKMHYMKLDNDLMRNQHMLKRINKQLEKISAEKRERPILRLNKNKEEKSVLEELHLAKQECCIVKEKIELQTTILNDVQKEMDDIQTRISSGKRPLEILDFETRAQQRLSIMESRITEQYNQTINTLNESIGECRQKLDVYVKKYNELVVINMGKDVSKMDKSLESLNSRLELKNLLEKLSNDRSQIVEAISQLSVTTTTTSA